MAMPTEKAMDLFFSNDFLNRVNDSSNSIINSFSSGSRGGNVKYLLLSNPGESSYSKTPQRVTLQ